MVHIWRGFLQQSLVNIVAKIRVIKPTDERDLIVTSAKGCSLYPVSAVAFKNLQGPGLGIIGSTMATCP